MKYGGDSRFTWTVCSDYNEKSFMNKWQTESSIIAKQEARQIIVQCGVGISVLSVMFKNAICRVVRV